MKHGGITVLAVLVLTAAAFVTGTGRVLAGDAPITVVTHPVYASLLQAAKARDLYTGLEFVNARQGLTDRIKLVGLGVGNSEAEVSIFQKKYQIPFPLFADPDFTAHKAVGGVGTPYFYVLRRKDGHKDFTVLSGTLGRMASPEAFLTEVVHTAGLKAPEAKP